MEIVALVVATNSPSLDRRCFHSSITDCLTNFGHRTTLIPTDPHRMPSENSASGLRQNMLGLTQFWCPVCPGGCMHRKTPPSLKKKKKTPMCHHDTCHVCLAYGNGEMLKRMCKEFSQNSVIGVRNGEVRRKNLLRSTLNYQLPYFCWHKFN